MDNEQTTTTESEVVNEQPSSNNVSQTLQAMVFGGEVSNNSTDTKTDLHEAQATTTATEEVAPTTETTVEETKPNWFKDKWGWDDENVAEREITTLKEKAAKAFEYKNDDSRKVAEYINEGKEEELYKFLDTKKRVEKLATSELTDKNIAAELVKFGIQKENPTLDASEVEFLFYEKYSIPEKPVQGELEDDADYQFKVNAWQNQVNNIEKRLIIEAKMQQPKLAQLKTELVLPEIQRNNQSQKPTPTQEELAAFAKERETFLQAATKSINDFNGVSVQVKDKDVNYTVGYSLSQDEKTLINGKIQQFAQSGYDANVLFMNDWVNSDKTLNVNKMTEDLSRIYFGKNAENKLAVDSGNKRLEAYLKDKKQIDIVQSPQGTFNPSKNGATTISDKLREAAFGV